MEDACCSLPTRRGALAAIGGMGALGALLPASSAPKTVSRKGMSVVLLGTQGGPPPNALRAGMASVVVVDGASYLVDAGRAAVTQYVRAGLAWADLRSVFVTHLHADHTADLFSVFMLGGFQAPAQGDSLGGPVPLYGPGPAGGLPPSYGGGSSPTVNPSDPTPGLASFFAQTANAYAYSSNVFMRDSGVRETSSLAEVHEIVLPKVGATYQNPAPKTGPFPVFEDDRVRVTATLVLHGPVFPAFAYRFDSDHGSVTFSGDTTYTGNLPRLARGSDLLVHEAINVQGWAGPAAVASHLLASHVEVQKVGAVAQAAQAQRLVLSHIGDLAQPNLDPQKWRRWAQQGYDGKVRIGGDLEVIRVR